MSRLAAVLCGARRDVHRSMRSAEHPTPRPAMQGAVRTRFARK